jgi:hypothetical protein
LAAEVEVAGVILLLRQLPFQGAGAVVGHRLPAQLILQVLLALRNHILSHLRGPQEQREQDQVAGLVVKAVTHHLAAIR